MTMRISKQSYLFPGLVLVLLLFGLVVCPSHAVAKMEYVSGSGMSEGDPGDGDDSMGVPGGASTPVVISKPAIIPENSCVYQFDQWNVLPAGSEFPILVFPFQSALNGYQGFNYLPHFKVGGR